MKIAIASGKGGTGKTTLSVNLASFLVTERKKNVILADFDVEEPNSNLFLDLKEISSEEKFVMVPSWQEESCIHCGKCAKVCKFNAIIKIPNAVMVFPELCHNCYACSGLCPTLSLPMIPSRVGVLNTYKKNNFLFLEGKLDVGVEKPVPLIREVYKAVEKTLKDEDIAIFDSPPGTSCSVMETVENADFVVLITEPTPFGFHDLKLAVETIKKLNKNFGVVINRYGSGNNDVEDWCEKQNISILGRLENRREIAETYSKGSLIYKDFPQIYNELGKIFDKISEVVK
jgi:MinD superfamily P-loop ATPase